jgi:hypothetical protein
MNQQRNREERRRLIVPARHHQKVMARRLGSTRAASSSNRPALLFAVLSCPLLHMHVQHQHHACLRQPLTPCKNAQCDTRRHILLLLLVLGCHGKAGERENLISSQLLIFAVTTATLTPTVVQGGNPLLLCPCLDLELGLPNC